MIPDGGDRDLREAFEAARKASHRSAPPFRRVVERRRVGSAGRRPRFRWVLMPVAAVFLFLLLPPLRGAMRARAELKLARQVMAWRSQTDFLLHMLIPDSLAVAPAIGRSPAGSPLRALDPGGPLGPPPLPRSPRL